MLKTLSSLISTFFFFAVIAIVLLICIFLNYSAQLPDYSQLAKYEPPVTTRLFAGDGQLLMEYATEKRLFVPVDKIPDRVKNAFIAAEDKNFYSHSGIDYLSILRAVVMNIKNIGSKRRPTGASTITQQVAKNFLLSSELSYKRKIKEAILANRMEQAFTKNHILELYLNEIYLGNRSYGVAAAALNYFGKALNELTIEEAAYLAALPKGPNNYDPVKKYDAAIARRDWVIDRMFDEGYVTQTEAEAAKEQPLKAIDRSSGFVQDAEYFSEEVRREITNTFGIEALYEGGLIVRTTVDPVIQTIATRAFKNAIKAYDTRHGWRGAVANIDINDEDFEEKFSSVEMPRGAEPSWKKAIVTNVKTDAASIETFDDKSGIIPFAKLSWARKTLKDQRVSDPPKSVSDVLQKGDVIYVEENKEGNYELRQVPNMEGAMIVMDPHTGKVLAVVGGYSFWKSQYNRATQAKRQTGSSFKPIVYLAALENNYSPTDLILDAPFVLDQGKGLPKWKPVNYSSRFYGLTTFRQGVEKSRNLMTVRLAQDLGMAKVVEQAKIMGVNDNLPKLLSMSLGAGETKLVSMATAYAMMVNGGKKITPYFIERIQDRQGKTILKHDKRRCTDCAPEHYDFQTVPELEDSREQVVDPLSAYQMVSILEGVALRGTGARLRSLGRHLAGKTGTTNDNKDAWFLGFSPDLVVGVYVGFDEPRSIGRQETAAAAALPIFHDFMKDALANHADMPFRIPDGIKLVRVNYNTGKPATPKDTTVITEALKPNFILGTNQKVIGSDSKPIEANELEGGKIFEDAIEDNEIQLGTQY